MFSTSEPEVTPESLGPGIAVRWLLGPRAGAPSAGLVGITEIAPGCGLPVHRHPHAEEAIVVLEGAGVISTGGDDEPAPAGSVLYAPAGAWHSVRAGSGPIRTFIVYSGATSLDGAGLEMRGDTGLADSGPRARVLRIDDVAILEVDDPEQGFRSMAARWLVDRDIMGSEKLVLGRSTFLPEAGSHELHRHPHAEEFMFLLEGEGDHLEADGRERPMAASDASLVSVDEWHGFRTRPGVETTTLFGYLGAATFEEAGYVLASIDASFRTKKEDQR